MVAKRKLADPVRRYARRVNTLIFQKKIGAGEEIRTLDPNLGKVVLYH